jgi:hypothetical protein
MSHFGRPSLGGRGHGKPHGAGAGAGGGKEAFSFPVLQPADIIDVLREMGVVVTEDDLNKPKAEQIRQICEQFVMDILGITKEAMYTPAEAELVRLGDTPDLHEESVPVVHFLHNMCVFMGSMRGRAGVRWRSSRGPVRTGNGCSPRTAVVPPLRFGPLLTLPSAPFPLPLSSRPRSNKVLLAAKCEEGFTLHDLIKPERSRVIRIFSALVNLQKFKKMKVEWYGELQVKKVRDR